jgi:hypothetical protein
VFVLAGTIQHLFFDCHYAHFLWRAVHWVFGITPPISVSHLFGGWPKLGRRKHNLLVLTGASALCWATWLTRNDFIFNKSQKQTFFHYYKNLNGGGRFTFPEAGISERLQWKVTVNQETTAAVK